MEFLRMKAQIILIIKILILIYLLIFMATFILFHSSFLFPSSVSLTYNFILLKNQEDQGSNYHTFQFHISNEIWVDGFSKISYTRTLCFPHGFLPKIKSLTNASLEIYLGAYCLGASEQSVLYPGLTSFDQNFTGGFYDNTTILPDGEYLLTSQRKEINEIKINVYELRISLNSDQIQVIQDQLPKDWGKNKLVFDFTNQFFILASWSGVIVYLWRFSKKNK